MVCLRVGEILLNGHFPPKCVTFCTELVILNISPGQSSLQESGPTIFDKVPEKFLLDLG